MGPPAKTRGGQLGSSSSSSSSCFAHCTAAPQNYFSRKFAVSGRSAQVRRFRGRSNSGVWPNPSLRGGRFIYILSFWDEKEAKKNFQTSHQKYTNLKMPKLDVGLFAKNLRPLKTQKRKTDCGCELLRARNATRNAQPHRLRTQHSPVDSHAQRAAASYVRDSQKRRRYETRAVRSISLRILRDIETIAPSVRSNTQQAKLDRNFIRSCFGTRKTFSSSKTIFFLTSGSRHKRTFSQRARACTLNPTLPYPDPPPPARFQIPQ